MNGKQSEQYNSCPQMNIAPIVPSQTKQVSVMLAGNMGQGALNVLTAHNIKVIRGCSGNILDVATDYLNGKLIDSGVGCSSHAHQHECHGHNHKE